MDYASEWFLELWSFFAAALVVAWRYRKSILVFVRLVFQEQEVLKAEKERKVDHEEKV